MITKNQIYLPLPYGDITSVNNFSHGLLSGLGRPTKRGIKKCFNCGEYNGTRSILCKNIECGVVLKDCEEKSKVNLDAVKLLTGTERLIYSVRVRDMGPDYRGFVQLPLLHSEDDGVYSEVPLCFVNSCQNSFDNSILRCHEEEQKINNLFCVHINSALKSQSTATPIECKNEVLQSLRVADDVKQMLSLLDSEREGPLVQRISKSVMAVKCQVSPKHPLGYLHFTFFKGKGRDVYEKYYCICTEFMISDDLGDKCTNSKYKCIHYYACIWALASNKKYWEEFLHFLSIELPTIQNMVVTVVPNVTNAVAYKNKAVPKSCVVNKMGEKKSLKRVAKKSSIKKCKRLMPKILPIQIKVLTESPDSNESTSWKFVDWLSYATESINMTMKFENCSIINTLTFYIPEEFYKSFKNRIPSIYEEIKTAETVTYSIMNILHLKEIFDTPHVKLKISKKFVHHEQKGFVEYDESEEDSQNYNCSFIFFLNVGQSTVDESDNTNNAFVIDWIPSFTGVTKVGQLKLHYKYGKKST